MTEKVYGAEFAGKPLVVKLGKLAQQASGSVLVQYGETSVLATVVRGKPTTRDYFPLSVEFEEKYYAAGKIKGSKWIKREGRPSEEAVLSARVIDRSIRPRFDHNIRNEVQCVATILSFDAVNDADMPSLFAVSLALMVSDIPYAGPVSSVRVGYVDGKYIINPTYKERAVSSLDVVVSGTTSRINMIEAGANIVSEDIVAGAIEEGFKALQELNALQTKIAKEVGATKVELDVMKRDEALAERVSSLATPRLEVCLYTPGKAAYYSGLAKAKEETMAELAAIYAEDPEKDKKMQQADSLFEEEIDRIVHKNILSDEKRPDGRKIDQLRHLTAEVGIIPHTHGNGLFDRGETQALSVLTLAAPGLEQWMETMEIDLTKKGFMHHYNFPPFSVGETGRIGAPGRREIGHGALAERALIPIIPSRDTFPYTIRIVSEILGSNGSSSMASVCGSSLALMDGGVPIKAPAAGIAMGLMSDDKGNYKILTDIQGPEDHHGDMDMKVAGTREGVTAMQMDVKVEGITPQIVRETLVQAKKARMEILDVLAGAIAGPRAELSPIAPRVHLMKVATDKIGLIIGSGGKTINGIIEETGATIDIEDDGTVFITCGNPEGMKKAIERIDQLTYEPKPGDEMDGTVVSIKDFGAFVEIAPGRDGMVHVSEISNERIAHPADVLKEGQKVHVWVKSTTPDGKISLSMVGPNGKQHAMGDRPPRTGFRGPRRE
ncbi:MAG TPA: polyribonucleotide nucleotidyltransferase [Candidatus Paceibacterota bacterium]|nr:polyribonucleotide nucleotidyltransferase [Candidatus Paceibacterota bacterium]